MFQLSVEIAIVSRNGIWVTMTVKISAGNSGPRRRHRSLCDMVLGGLRGAAVTVVAALMVCPPRDERRRADRTVAGGGLCGAVGGGGGGRPAPRGGRARFRPRSPP